MYSLSTKKCKNVLHFAFFCLVLTIIGTTSETFAQGTGLFNPFSPSIAMPYVQGEIKFVPNVSSISNSTAREQFGFLNNAYFIDLMVRLQLNRFSIRVNFDPREFTGFKEKGETRLFYQNLRIGTDFDLIQWNRSRLGINFDYDTTTPEFIVGWIGHSGARFRGDNAATLGFHLTYNPLSTVYGASPIVEAKARWPLTSTQVTDWDISGGIKAPETVLGSWALKFGFRNENINFTKRFDRSNVNFDTTIDSWFMDFTYYY